MDITSTGKVNVNGNNSVGYILVQGEGSNAGNITVNAQNALGFYGKTGKFENTGNKNDTYQIFYSEDSIFSEKKSTQIGRASCGERV